MTERLSGILRELRERLAALYGDRLDKLILYGSQARGDAEPGSDIDVLVVLKGSVRRWDESRRTSEICAAISLKNGLEIFCMFISAERYRRDDEPLLANARREGVAI